jgi:hypothetical protein
LQARFNGTPSKAPAGSSLATLAVTGKYATKVVASLYSSFPQTPAGVYDFNVTVQAIAPVTIPLLTGTAQAVEQNAANTVLGSASFGPSVPIHGVNIATNRLFPNPVVGSKPFAMAAGDFNNDGNPDIAVQTRETTPCQC